MSRGLGDVYKRQALISGGEVEEACELMGCHIDNQASTVSDVIRRDQVEYHR